MTKRKNSVNVDSRIDQDRPSSARVTTRNEEGRRIEQSVRTESIIASMQLNFIIIIISSLFSPHIILFDNVFSFSQLG